MMYIQSVRTSIQKQGENSDSGLQCLICDPESKVIAYNDSLINSAEDFYFSGICGLNLIACISSRFFCDRKFEISFFNINNVVNEQVLCNFKLRGHFNFSTVYIKI